MVRISDICNRSIIFLTYVYKKDSHHTYINFFVELHQFGLNSFLPICMSCLPFFEGTTCCALKIYIHINIYYYSFLSSQQILLLKYTQKKYTKIKITHTKCVVLKILLI